MKVFDYIYDAFQKAKQTLNTTPGETRLLSSGLPEVAPATRPYETGAMNIGEIFHPSASATQNYTRLTGSNQHSQVPL
jgi:hypothetical protein